MRIMITAIEQEKDTVLVNANTEIGEIIVLQEGVILKEKIISNKFVDKDMR